MKKNALQFRTLAAACCLLAATALTFHSCKKGGDAVADTPAPAASQPVASGKASITCDEPKLDGAAFTVLMSVTDYGGMDATSSGVCFGTSENPTVSDTKEVNTDPPQFQYPSFKVFLSLSQMQPLAKYYARAYLTNKTGTYYSNQVSFTTPLWVGAPYGGGTIAQLDDTGLHGLIASSQDLSRGIAWAPGNLFATATEATSRTDGMGNTTKILAAYGSGNYAAKLCHDYRGGGFTDWYLPALSEATTLLFNQNAIGGFEQPLPSTLLIEYWTSTESSYFQAWDMEFRYGDKAYISQKNLTRDVRAVRKF